MVVFYKPIITADFILLNISSMAHIIHNYKSMSDFYIAQLTKEIAIYRYSEEERAKLLDFINYLRSITHELEDMLLVKD